MKRQHTHTKQGVKKRHKRRFKSPAERVRDNNAYDGSGKLRVLRDFEVLS